MLRKKIAGAVIASVAIAMVATVAPQANAALKAPTAANVGDQCVTAGRVAKGRGVNGSDLTCTNVTTGTSAGSRLWWYADMKPFGSIEWVSSSAIGGGYGTTAIATVSYTHLTLPTNREV